MKKKKQKSHFYFINLYFLVFALSSFLSPILIDLLGGSNLNIAIGTIPFMLLFWLYGGIFIAYLLSWIYTLSFYGINKKLKNRIPNFWLRNNLIIFGLCFLLMSPIIIASGILHFNFRDLAVSFAVFFTSAYFLAYLMSKYDMKQL